MSAMWKQGVCLFFHCLTNSFNAVDPRGSPNWQVSQFLGLCANSCCVLCTYICLSIVYCLCTVCTVCCVCVLYNYVCYVLYGALCLLYIDCMCVMYSLGVQQTVCCMLCVCCVLYLCTVYCVVPMLTVCVLCQPMRALCCVFSHARYI